MNDLAVRAQNLGKVYRIGHTVGYKPGDFPESEQAQEHALTLPMYPGLTDDQIGNIVQAISQFTEED